MALGLAISIVIACVIASGIPPGLFFRVLGGGVAIAGGLGALAYFGAHGFVDFL